MSQDASTNQAGKPKGEVPVEAYRIAFEEGRRRLDEQRDELNVLRTRAVTFIAFIGTATAFLVGTGLSSTVRAKHFQTIALTGTCLTLGGLACLVVILWPRWKFAFSMEPKTLVERWLDRDVPANPTETQLLRAWAGKQQSSIDRNHTSLEWMRWLYLGLVVAGPLGLACWTWLIWQQR